MQIHFTPDKDMWGTGYTRFVRLNAWSPVYGPGVGTLLRVVGLVLGYTLSCFRLGAEGLVCRPWYTMVRDSLLPPIFGWTSGLNVWARGHAYQIVVAVVVKGGGRVAEPENRFTITKNKHKLKYYEILYSLTHIM